MSVQCHHAGVVAGREDVIEQQADPHAAVRRVEQGANKRIADDVALDQVVLRVDTALGALSQEQPHCQRIDAIRHWVYAGLPLGLPGNDVGEVPTQSRLCGIAKCRRFGARIVEVNTRAAGKQSQEKNGNRLSHRGLV